MSLEILHAISPIDGRYRGKTESLRAYFSEYALIKYRVFIEIKYFIALSEVNAFNITLDKDQKAQIMAIHTSFDDEDALKIKSIEKVTNHDVKAVEYFIKEKFDGLNLSHYKEWIHFGLTSQDINNTAMPLMLQDGLRNTIIPMMVEVVAEIESLASVFADIPLLAKTHGQPASPTLLGKELFVFVERLKHQLSQLSTMQQSGKFGGATGNFNAHKVTFPNEDWKAFGDQFLVDLGIRRLSTTTQISHYDDEAQTFHTCVRIQTILIDFCRDVWTYISMEYFKQKVVANEVGSSAMPHKVNPIDFENAEGNLMYSNAILEFLARKLPISRLQRDLTDSTVTRNIGVPLSHTIIALQSIKKGISKLQINKDAIEKDLNDNWAVVAEAIQNILRREGVENPYEKLKALTRGNHKITKTTIADFIKTLPVSDHIKNELAEITPSNYVGYSYSEK